MPDESESSELGPDRLWFGVGGLFLVTGAVWAVLSAIADVFAFLASGEWCWDFVSTAPFPLQHS